MELIKNLIIYTLASYFLRSAVSTPGTVGINYGRIADNLPPPPRVVQLLKAQRVTKVKLFDANSAVLSAFSGTGIFVTVALPNELLPDAAAAQSFTDSWIGSNILYHLPGTAIEAIAVGNEVFDNRQNITRYLVPAMENVYASLTKYGVVSSIKVSSPVAVSALLTSYPPSTGSFKPDLVELAVKPMLDFLQRTGSYLMVNTYPFFAYASNSDKISLDYVLFRQNSGVVDPNNGLVYKSLFDAQIDAVYAAMAQLGFTDLKVVISETGWPSKGDEDEIGANPQNAAEYNGNLVRRVLSGGGTPIRPAEPLTVYLFALFNEYQKPGPTSERNYGLFYPDERRVYDIPLTVEDVGGGSTLISGSAKHAVDGTGRERWPAGSDDAGGEMFRAPVDAARGHMHGVVTCRSTRVASLIFLSLFHFSKLYI